MAFIPRKVISKWQNYPRLKGSLDVPALQKQVDDLKETNMKLVGTNNDLHKTLSEKEKIGAEFSNLQSKYHNLETLYNNTKEELELCKSELQVSEELSAHIVFEDCVLCRR